MRAGGWARDGRPVALRELAFGLVGFGGVGREVARRLAAFGATEVQFVDPVAPPPGWWAEQQEDGASACRCGRSAPPAHPAASLAALAAAADVLILACDLNPSSVKSARAEGGDSGFAVATG